MSDESRNAHGRDTLLGSLFAGRYRLEEVAGRGGMATVYRATDELLGRPVAAKILSSSSADTEEVRRQQGEVRLLASLSHPGLVTLFDAGAADTPEGPRAFLVMELVRGVTLRERMTDGPMTFREVAGTGADLADSLHYIHRRDVVHRDIKPGNILLVDPAEDDTGVRTKLADFGIARIVDGSHMTVTGAIIGTVSYLSPEQAMGEPVGPPADIYALGLVLLECLTGQKAFPGGATESIMARVLRDPEVPASFSPEWSGLLRAMTARKPEDRPTAREVSDVLRRLSRPRTATRGTVTAATADGTVPGESGLLATALLPQPPGPQGGADTADIALLDEPTRATPEPAATGTRTPPSAATDVLPESDDGLRIFTPPQPDEGAAAPAPAAAAPTPAVAAAPADRRPRRRLPALTGTVIAAVLLALAAWGVTSAVSPPSSPDPAVTYPPVQGPLGTSLERLQESVESPE
jgi:eukaryotic-like serine/threonine-protein kinase